MLLTPDEVLEHVGSFGKYQVLLIFILGIPTMIGSFHPYFMVFSGLDPPWRCVEMSPHCNLTGPISLGQEHFSDRCSLPRESWEFVGPYTSVVTKWDLVCSDAHLAGLCTSVMAIGGIFGRIIIGMLSDAYGRKLAIYLCLASVSLLQILSGFASMFWFYVLCRFFIGFFAEAMFGPLFALACEFSGIRYRGVSGSLIWVLFGVGLIVLGLLAWLIHDWVILSVVTGASGLLACIMCIWTPESARWLLVKNKEKQARKTFEVIARINRKEMPGCTLQVPKNTQKGGRILDLFRTRREAMINIIQWFIWFACALVYGGVILNVSGLGGNLYLNFSIQGVGEIFGDALAAVCINRFGRKKSMVFQMIVSAISSIFVVIIPLSDNPGYLAGRVIFATLAKLVVTSAWCTIAVYTAEITPTVIRNIALGACATTISFSYFLASYLFLLRGVWPFVVLAAVALVASFLAVFLPETSNQPTPEFLEKTEIEERVEDPTKQVIHKVSSL